MPARLGHNVRLEAQVDARDKIWVTVCHGVSGATSSPASLMAGGGGWLGTARKRRQGVL
jgi:hypothetical protein